MPVVPFVMLHIGPLMQVKKVSKIQKCGKKRIFFVLLKKKIKSCAHWTFLNVLPSWMLHLLVGLTFATGRVLWSTSHIKEAMT